MKNIINILFLLVLGCSYSMAQDQCFEPDASIWKDTWRSCEISQNPNATYGQTHWIQYDFGSLRKLSKTWVWNTNDPARLDQGFQQVKIDFSEDGQTWTHWGEMSFPKANGSAVYGGFEGPDLQNVQARYVLVTAMSNHGHPSCSGIAEIKFNLAPDYEGIQLAYEEEGEECEADGDIEYMEVLATEAFILWSYEGEADYFVFHYREEGGEVIELETDEPEVFLEYLQPNTTYEYRIGIECEEESFIYSDIMTFTTLPLDPNCVGVNQIELVEATENTATIGWETVPEVDLYVVRFGGEEDWEEIETEETTIELEDIAAFEQIWVRVGVLCGEEVLWSEQFCIIKDGNGFIATSVFPQERELSNVNLSPNPTSGSFVLNYSSFDKGRLQFKVLNMQGATIYKDESNILLGNNQLHIDLSTHPDGVYYVQGQRADGNASFAQKIVKIGK